MNRKEETQMYMGKAEGVLRLVERRHGLNKGELKGKRRGKKVSYSRHLAMAVCRDITPLSYPAIGRLFGFRDHSTVIHGCDRSRKRYQESAEYRAEFLEVRRLARKEMELCGGDYGC